MWTGRQHDQVTLAGRPAIHARVGVDDFVVTQTVATGDIDQVSSLVA